MAVVKTKAQQNQSRIARIERDNHRAAAVILADIRKYGGEGSIAVQWACAIRSKPGSTWQPTKHEQGELFL